MSRKLDIQQDRGSRIRSYLKDNRTATFREVASHFGLTVRQVEDELRPGNPVAAIVCCEAPYCLLEGRFGTPKGFFCHAHKD